MLVIRDGDQTYFRVLDLSHNNLNGIIPESLSLWKWIPCLLLSSHWKHYSKQQSDTQVEYHCSGCQTFSLAIIAFQGIIEATNDFDIRYCIGTCGYGSVYRVQLPSGKIVALKKLHRREAEVPAFDRSFKKAKMLSEIRHKNIVKLHGFCLHNRCMFLIYEYMPRGSLFSVFKDDVEAAEMGWSKRVKVIKDTASALSYLHHDCHPPKVHHDCLRLLKVEPEVPANDEVRASRAHFLIKEW
ncbi:putative kinase [Hibiscus syriacus]|uniref:non-specific serine/threonine protein kinase n=1 Tax=Hibiscus syriacus TaxID=106335 RepID=A0A6A3B6N4_HIBSY|nr:putative kinase [Hibiscus syriacus]